MPAYLVLDIKVHDPARYEDYKRMAAPTVSMFDGKYIVRGGQTKTMEGDWLPSRAVILEFPTRERAEAWWNSDEYREAKALRQSIATTQMVLMEGY